MNLQDLRYLVAVSDKQHFGKAAKACFVSQPTLSMQLRKLEEFLGVQLVERTNKRVAMTAAGARLAAEARTIVELADDLVESAKALRNPFIGSIKLGAFPTLAPYFLPKAIPKLSTAFRELKVFLIEEKTDVLINQLHARKIDAALLASPIDEDGFESVEILKDTFRLAVPRKHRLSERKRVSRDDISNDRLLLLEEGHCLRSQALEFCEWASASEQQDFRATSLETLRQMVATGIGITLIPELAVIENDASVAYIPFKSPAPSRTISLYWRKSSSRRELFIKLAEKMRR